MHSADGAFRVHARASGGRGTPSTLDLNGPQQLGWICDRDPVLRSMYVDSVKSYIVSQRRVSGNLPVTVSCRSIRYRIIIKDILRTCIASRGQQPRYLSLHIAEQRRKSITFLGPWRDDGVTAASRCRTTISCSTGPS